MVYLFTALVVCVSFAILSVVFRMRVKRNPYTSGSFWLAFAVSALVTGGLMILALAYLFSV